MSNKTRSSPKLSKVKSGLLSRGLSLAKLSMQAGTQLASHRINRFLNPDQDPEESFKALLLSQVQLLTEELGNLKGSLMKVGQMLSMYGEHFLPPEINVVLKSLQFQSPPLEWKAIQKALQKELGKEVLAELEIEHEPWASASLGQVHRATIRSTGERVAIKVQYPGVDRAVEADLKALRGIFKTAQMLPLIPHLDHLFEEVKVMLKQEIDYSQELRNTEEYRQLLASDSRFAVPRIYPRYSSSRVLTTEYLEGLPPDSPEVKALSQERRNRLAGMAYELYLRELFDWGVVQTDPHLGNYRIAIDPAGSEDRLILLDFGAIRRFSKDFIRNYRAMSRGALVGDRPMLERAAMKLGFLEAEDPQGLKDIFYEFCRLIVEPFVYPPISEEARSCFDPEGAYLWKTSDLPKRLARKVGTLILNFKLREPPQEVVFLDRKTGGVFIFLSVLDARFNARPILEKYLR